MYLWSELEVSRPSGYLEIQQNTMGCTIIPYDQ